MPVALKKRYGEFKKNLYIEGALSFANFSLLTGLFLVGFALEIGAGPLTIGILGSIPLFANLLQFFSAFILEATGTKKKTAIICLNLARVIWLPIVFIAFGLWVGVSPVGVLVIITIIYSILTALGSLALLSWIKDLVPVRKLSEFLGKRNSYASIAGIFVYLLGSVIVDYSYGLNIYGIIFLFSIFIGLVSTLMLRRIPERKKKIKALSFKDFLERMSVPFKDEKFRPLLRYGLIWGFVLNLLGPFWAVFMLKDLKIAFFLTSLFYIVDTVTRIYGFNMWVQFVDRYGSRPTLIVAGTMMSLSPLLFMFVTPGNYMLIIITFLISGVAFSGTEIATLRALFKSAPRKMDAYYLSAFTSSVGLASAFGPIAGGLIVTFITKSSLVPVTDFLVPIRYLFFISFIARVLCIPLMSGIVETQARTVDDVLIRMRKIRYFSIFTGIYGFASIASKLVLFPSKQLFFIQRKTALRLKDDVKETIRLMEKLVNALGNIRKANLKYYQWWFSKQRKDLQKSVDKLSYAQGTWYSDIPALELKKIEKFEEAIEDKNINEVRTKAGRIRRLMDYQIKKLKGAYERNLK